MAASRPFFWIFSRKFASRTYSGNDRTSRTTFQFIYFGALDNRICHKAEKFVAFYGVPLLRGLRSYRSSDVSSGLTISISSDCYMFRFRLREDITLNIMVLRHESSVTNMGMKISINGSIPLAFQNHRKFREIIFVCIQIYILHKTLSKRDEEWRECLWLQIYSNLNENQRRTDYPLLLENFIFQYEK